MTPPPSGLANAAGSLRQEMAAVSSIGPASPTRCQARTRLYRDGTLELEGFPVADISDRLPDGSVTIWLDLRGPNHDDLAVLSEEFGLHPLAVEEALRHSQRSKLDRYPSHLFLTAYGTRLDPGTGELATSELSAFITSRALITVGYLLYGLLDYIVDGHFEALQSLDDCVEELEDRLFDDHHCPDWAGALPHLQTQGLAIRPKISMAGQLAAILEPRRRSQGHLSAKRSRGAPNGGFRASPADVP